MAYVSNATTWPLGILFFCKQSSHLEHQMKNVNVLSRWYYVNTPIHDITSLPIKRGNKDDSWCGWVTSSLYLPQHKKKIIYKDLDVIQFHRSMFYNQSYKPSHVEN
jgi:hypothetical protein